MDTKKVSISTETITALNEELDYQNKMADTERADGVDNGLSGQLVTLGTYADKARDAWTMSAGNESALNELRKVAAIAIRGLEAYGCPRR